jgi:AcrR family transcriptional regulator
MPRRSPRPRPAAPRWRRQPEARPAQILDAALVEFGERGLANARLDDIAKRAGVAKGTIYLYFPTKDDLFRAMVRHIAGRAIGDFELQMAADAKSAAPVRIRHYVEAMWEHLRSPTFAVLYRLTMGELPDFPDLMRFYIRETAERTLKICAGILRGGVERGEFRRLDPDATARMIHAIVIKHAVWCAHRREMRFVAAASDAHVLRDMHDFIHHALRPVSDPTPARRARPRRRPRA